MTERKWTPGEWRVVEDAGNAYNLRVAADANPHVAKVYGWGDNCVAANAHLIAAAPDLYEALEQAHTFIADEYADAESQALDGEHVSREARPVWNAICAALAKARGET